MLPDDVRAVCFDIGGVLVEMPRGTLADELGDVLDCEAEQVRRLLIEHGKCRRTDTRTLASILARSCPGALHPDPAVEEVLRRRLNDIAEPKLFPDAIPTLQELADAGWRICFLTNAIGTPDERPVPGYYSFDEVVGHSWEIGHCKPCPEAFRAVERRMSLRPDQIVKVGDSPRFDLDGAQRAGWAAVHLARAGGAATPAVPHVIASLRELPALLPRRNSSDLVGKAATADVID